MMDQNDYTQFVNITQNGVVKKIMAPNFFIPAAGNEVSGVVAASGVRLQGQQPIVTWRPTHPMQPVTTRPVFRNVCKNGVTTGNQLSNVEHQTVSNNLILARNQLSNALSQTHHVGNSSLGGLRRVVIRRAPGTDQAQGTPIFAPMINTQPVHNRVRVVLTPNSRTTCFRTSTGTAIVTGLQSPVEGVSHEVPTPKLCAEQSAAPNNSRTAREESTNGTCSTPADTQEEAHPPGLGGLQIGSVFSLADAEKVPLDKSDFSKVIRIEPEAADSDEMINIKDVEDETAAAVQGEGANYEVLAEWAQEDLLKDTMENERSRERLPTDVNPMTGVGQDGGCVPVVLPGDSASRKVQSKQPTLEVTVKGDSPVSSDEVASVLQAVVNSPNPGAILAKLPSGGVVLITPSGISHKQAKKAVDTAIKKGQISLEHNTKAMSFMEPAKLDSLIGQAGNKEESKEKGTVTETTEITGNGKLGRKRKKSTGCEKVKKKKIAPEPKLLTDIALCLKELDKKIEDPPPMLNDSVSTLSATEVGADPLDLLPDFDTPVSSPQQTGDELTNHVHEESTSHLNAIPASKSSIHQNENTRCASISQALQKDTDRYSRQRKEATVHENDLNVVCSSSGSPAEKSKTLQKVSVVRHFRLKKSPKSSAVVVLTPKGLGTARPNCPEPARAMRQEDTSGPTMRLENENKTETPTKEIAKKGNDAQEPIGDQSRYFLVKTNAGNYLVPTSRSEASNSVDLLAKQAEEYLKKYLTGSGAGTETQQGIGIPVRGGLSRATAGAVGEAGTVVHGGGIEAHPACPVTNLPKTTQSTKEHVVAANRGSGKESAADRIRALKEKLKQQEEKVEEVRKQHIFSATPLGV